MILGKTGTEIRMNQEFDWDCTDFEIRVDNVEVMGYFFNGEIVWYSWDGFECYDDFEKTNAVAENPFDEEEDNVKYLRNWKMIKWFLSKVDIAGEFKNQSPRIISYFDGEIKLYVNCSEYDREPDNYRFGDTINCFVKYREW